MAAGAAPAGAQVLPDTIKPPAGLNLGGTSFYDGFGATKPGLTFINYGRFNFYDRLNGDNAAANPEFTAPSFNAQTELFQFVYRSPVNLGPGGFGFNVVVPATNLDARFRPPGIVLRDNGFGLGDVTFGPLYQSDVIVRDGRPVFSWRTEFDVIAPVGAFNKTVSINQSSGFWSINPYLAFTYLPVEKVEVSLRLNYLHNLETSRIADPPPIPGLIYRSGQAGDLGWINFAASYAVTERVSLGVNGYYLRQFSFDRLNRIEIPGTKQEQLYVGPGAHIKIDEKNIFNLNLYIPALVRNGPSGPQVNYQFIHLF